MRISFATLLIGTCALGIGITAASRAPAQGGGKEDHPTVVLAGPALLAKEFSIGRTLAAILQSRGLPSDAAAQEALLKTMIATFDLDEASNAGFRMRVPKRPGEAALDAKALLGPGAGGLVPVGLFNRFDLAPESFDDCGEYRIVYARRAPAFNQRLTLIFEAALPNPGKGAAGCEPILNVWRGLKGKTPAARVQPLADFYYKIGSGQRPVVHWQNFGSPAGQVRGNLFVGGPWQLRDWLIAEQGGSLAFVPDPVNNTAIASLYRDTNGADSLDPATETALRASFANYFTGTGAGELLQVDRVAPGFGSGNTTAHTNFAFELINRVGLKVPATHNQFHSDAQVSDVDAGPAFKARLTTANFPAIGGAVSPDQLLKRAELNTCGGCHDVSNGAQIGTYHGKTVAWPASLRFVHIDEAGQLSPALKDFFLPFRARIVAAPAAQTIAAAPTPASLFAKSVRRSAIAAALRASVPKDKSLQVKREVELQTLIREEREAAQSEPGAFVAVRRPH